jgi:hypothetical protein
MEPRPKASAPDTWDKLARSHVRRGRETLRPNLCWALLWAEWLREEVLEWVAHRHVVLTIPRLLRPLFRRRRELLTELARAAAEAVNEFVRRSLGGHALLLMRLFRDRLLARLVESHPVRRAKLVELFRSSYPNREILPE